MKQLAIYNITPFNLRLLMGLWPPFLAAGISIRHVSSDFRELTVQMKMRWFNRNYVGTHFGGSLYAMTDPFYMLMVMRNLGRDYIVWDKSSGIEFIAPGKGTVAARFHLNEDILNQIREKTSNGEKYLPQFEIEVRDEQEELVAKILRTLYVRKKKR